MNTNLTVEDIDQLREESIKEWALAGAGLAEVHRFLARKIEQRLLADRAALNETIITLEAALSGRHEDVARLTIRVGQLEEALRLAGLGKAALEARTPATPVSCECGKCEWRDYFTGPVPTHQICANCGFKVAQVCRTPAAPVVAEGKLPPLSSELYENYPAMSAQHHEKLVKDYARAAHPAAGSPADREGA